MAHAFRSVKRNGVRQILPLEEAGRRTGFMKSYIDYLLPTRSSFWMVFEVLFTEEVILPNR